MKKITILCLFVFSFLSHVVMAQNYKTLLTNGSSKTWRLTDMYINGERFTDNESTCIYQIKMTFNTNGTYSKVTPCSATKPAENGVFVIVSDSLIINGYPFKINSLTSTQLETNYISDVTGTDSLKKAPVIQRFQTQ